LRRDQDIAMTDALRVNLRFFFRNAQIYERPDHASCDCANTSACQGCGNWACGYERPDAWDCKRTQADEQATDATERGTNASALAYIIPACIPISIC
jgi:hypothetical protein